MNNYIVAYTTTKWEISLKYIEVEATSVNNALSAANAILHKKGIVTPSLLKVFVEATE